MPSVLSSFAQHYTQWVVNFGEAAFEYSGDNRLGNVWLDKNEKVFDSRHGHDSSHASAFLSDKRAQGYATQWTVRECYACGIVGPVPGGSAPGGSASGGSAPGGSAPGVLSPTIEAPSDDDAAAGNDVDGEASAAAASAAAADNDTDGVEPGTQLMVWSLEGSPDTDSLFATVRSWRLQRRWPV